MFSNDELSSEQFLSSYRPLSKTLQSGELALCFAILEDAVSTLFSPKRVSERYKDDWQEAMLWLKDDSEWWIFSFRSVCNISGFDPDVIRKGVLDNLRRQGCDVDCPVKLRKHKQKKGESPDG